MVNMKLDKRNEQLIDSLKNLKLHGMAEDLKNRNCEFFTPTDL